MNNIVGLTFQSVGFDVKGKPEYSTSVTSWNRRELHQELRSTHTQPIWFLAGLEPELHEWLHPNNAIIQTLSFGLDSPLCAQTRHELMLQQKVDQQRYNFLLY